MRILSVATKITEEIDNKWQGGTGAYLSDIIDQVNAFTSDSKELAILNLSHAYNFDRAGPHNRNASLKKDEWHRLMSDLSRLNDLYASNNFATPDLHNVPLKDFIQGKKAAVLVLIGEENIDLGDYAKKGFYYKQLGREILTLKNGSFFDPKNKDKPGKLMSFYVTHKLNIKESIYAWAYDRGILGAASSMNKLTNMGQTIVNIINQPTAENKPAYIIIDKAKIEKKKIFPRIVGAVRADAYPNIIAVDDLHDSAPFEITLSVMGKAMHGRNVKLSNDKGTWKFI